MARWTPDPFYPSPQQPRHHPEAAYAYVATLNTGSNGDRAPDALTVLDLEPGSPTYGQLVGRLEMPGIGDELHHFGWNACSSALCPWAPHPHVERRYLCVPGLRWSRRSTYVVDVKDDPHAPKIVKVIEADEIARKAGYSRRHTIHCGPDGIYVSALGDPEGDGPGGIFLLDHDDFSVEGAWEDDRGTASWPTTRALCRRRCSRPLGHAEDGRGRAGGRAAARQQVRPQAPRLGPQEAPPHPGDRPRTGASDGARGCRPAHDIREATGSSASVTSTADLSASVWLWERGEHLRPGAWARGR